MSHNSNFLIKVFQKLKKNFDQAIDAPSLQFSIKIFQKFKIFWSNWTADSRNEIDFDFEASPIKCKKMFRSEQQNKVEKKKKEKKFAIQSRLVTLQILKKQFIFRTNSTYSKKEINMHIHKMSFLLSQLFFFQIFFCYQGYLFPSLKHWMVLANLQRTNGSRWTDQKTTHQGENKLKKI